MVTKSTRWLGALRFGTTPSAFGSRLLLYACRWRAPVVALAIIGSFATARGRQGDGRRVDHHSGHRNILRSRDNDAQPHAPYRRGNLPVCRLPSDRCRFQAATRDPFDEAGDGALPASGRDSSPTPESGDGEAATPRSGLWTGSPGCKRRRQTK